MDKIFVSLEGYQEYLKEKDQSVKYDESKTLYDLLRNAVYKQYQSEHKKK